MNELDEIAAAASRRTSRRRRRDLLSRGGRLLATILLSSSSSSSSSWPSSSPVVVALRRRPSPPAAFVPRDEGLPNNYRRRRRSERRMTPVSAALLGVGRGGGGADEASEERGGDAADGRSDGLDHPHPLVDVSVVESEDASANGAIGDVEADSDASESELDTYTSDADAPEKAIDDGDEDEDDDDVGDRNDGSDLAEFATDSDDEPDARAAGEGSDSDVPDPPASTSRTAATPDDADGPSERRSSLRSSASDLRAEGKALHDGGSLSDAARAFREAASLLDEALSLSSPPSELSEEDRREDEDEDDDSEGIAVERATCRLHEALCLFKDGRPGECVDACSDVLGDGVAAVPLEGADAEDDGDASSAGREGPAAVVKVVPPPAGATTGARIVPAIPPQIRARAHHRRAKARLALDDLDGALEDARSAAFMGDRNAVQFYGRLMREGSGAALAAPSAAGGSSSSSGGGGFGGGGGALSSNPFLEGILEGMGGGPGGGNPLMSSGSGAGSGGDFSSSLLSSLLTGGRGDGGNPLGLMGELLAPPKEEGKKSRRGRRGGRREKAAGGGMDGLAKSVLSNLVKRIEDEETQETICKYLNSAETQQVMQFAAVAGVPLKEESARRLVRMANGVTPRGISKGVSRVKRGISIVKTARTILKVVDKYKAYIILAVLLYWIRSAVVQPYPASKRARRELAQKAAWGVLAAPCRGGGSGPSLGDLCGGAVRALGALRSSGGESVEGNDGASQTSIEEELERLQNRLSLIEALEERNKAQLDSFVDEEDQWDSLEEDERVLLNSKDSVVTEMEALTERLVMLFMGQKMRDG